MYIFELIAKKIKEKKHKDRKDYCYTSPVLNDDYEKCEHIFLPIDSTGKILACTKCGKLVQNNIFAQKNRNPFG